MAIRPLSRAMWLILAQVLAGPIMAADLPLGTSVKAVHQGDPTVGLVAGGGKEGWHAEFPVSLSAGQTVKVVVAAKGKTRKIASEIYDPSGKLVTPRAVTKLESNSSELIAEELNADGKYRIVVVSDQIGPFTVNVTVISDGEDSIEELESQLLQLKTRLADVESRLRKAKSKGQ